MSYRSWVFTLNNYEKKHLDYLEQHFILLTNVLFVSFEVGEEGTPHLQGYFTLKRPKRLPALKKLLGDQYHFARAQGDRNDNQCYVFKDGSTPFINHDNGGRGKRNDITDFIDLVNEHGKRYACTVDPEVYVKYHKGLNATFQVLQEPEPRTDYPKVVWLFGPTGIGKSEYAHNHESCHDAYMYPWFDGYLNQECVLFDEIEKEGESTIKLKNLLKLTDRYPMRVPVKGGSVQFNPSVIVITSSVHPSNLYPDTDYQQVERRITHIGTRESRDVDWRWLK